MRRYLILFTTFAAIVLGGNSGKAATDEAFAKLDGDVVVRLHFAGTAQIAADPRATNMNQMFALPTWWDLREKTMEKLATAPYRLIQKKINAENTNDFSALIRPLLEDLLSNESYLEVRGATDQVPEMMLAVHLNDNQAKTWESYLSTILVSWTGMPTEKIQGDGYAGWELKKHHDPNLTRFIRVGDWVLFGWGENELHLQPGFLQRIKASKRPAEAAKDTWLDALVDWPAINTNHPITLPIPLPANLPKLHLVVEGRTNYIRPKLTMLFPQPLNLKLDPWKIPATYIHNPIVSFTAVRGIEPWLAQIPEVKVLHPNPVPNQLIFWSMSDAPFESAVATPMPGASKYLAELSPLIISNLNTTIADWPMASHATWTNNRVRVNMPFVSPFIGAITEPAGDFLIGELFPIVPRTNAAPLPLDLMREIGSKPNLVLYSWEINAERISQWEALNQVRLLASAKYGPTRNSPGNRWFQSAKTNLTFCGSEITLTAPNELTLIRNSPLGLSGFELMVLDFWVDAPNFPLGTGYARPANAPTRPPISQH